MTNPKPDALEFLLTRRSRPYKILGAPVPDRAALEPLLTAAMRVPDHGKLEPWRFIVLEKPALSRLADLAEARAWTLCKAAEDITKARAPFDMAHLVVAVIETQIPSEKVPPVEQTYSAGAACLSLVNAALAAGWGANWLSGWTSHDREFVETGLGLKTHETVAGFIHIGTATQTPPDRPRPDLVTKVSWVKS